MKKIAIILIVSVAAFFALGGRTLLQDPAATIEAFAVRHADVLPLEMFGNSLFDKHCASCHDNPAMHAPSRQSLAGFSKESIMIALEFGKMQPMAAHLSKQERGLITMYLSGRDTQSYAWLEGARCDKTVRDGIEYGDKKEYVGNWGLGKNNQRFASNQTAGITKDNVA
jgi:polyvinyl alcohol dehydrogenase (cytochrome)